MKLPDFVCVGAMRCGTTTLWAELRAHPGIFLPQIKELHFFDRDADQGLAAYAAHFAGAPEGRLRGEITPSYMYRGDWRRRLHEALPEAKLLAILRDPVGRAWSHYRYSVRWGPEHLDFRTAIETEETRIARDYDSLIHFSYVTRGFYAEQLEAFAELHGRERLKVVFLDDLRRDRRETLEGIRAFLGLSAPFPDAPPPTQNEITDFPRSVGLHARTRRMLKSEGGSLPRRMARKFARRLHERNLAPAAPRLDPGIAADLAARYAPHDARLEAFLGRSAPWRHSGAD
jgi:hypothetical protein